MRTAVFRKTVFCSLSRRLLVCLAFLVVTGVAASPHQAHVQACPGCKAANETESRRPRAYMYSILFMLGMPATVFTGFGVAFYRMSKKASLAQSPELAELLMDAPGANSADANQQWSGPSVDMN